MQPTFKSMRRDGAIKRGEANAVRLEDIHEEPGFNELARDYDESDTQAIEELAAFIKAGGIYPALEVRPRAEGGVWLVDGHLRSRALRLLDSRGDLPRTPNKDDPTVLEAWVNVTPFVGNDAERILRLDTSSQRKDPGDLARGRIYSALMAHNWTPAQIATRTGKPLTTIQRILTLASGNTDVHEMVKAGEVKPTIAAQAVKAHGDKAGAVLNAALVEAKAIGKTRVTNAVLKPKKGWQLCSDGELPKEGVQCLVVVNGVVRIGARYWDEPMPEDTYQPYMYWDDPENDGQGWEIDDVTHWMPAPWSEVPGAPE
jgi:ParB-like chromosome segregation protein Spo0J